MATVDLGSKFLRATKERGVLEVVLDLTTEDLALEIAPVSPLADEADSAETADAMMRAPWRAPR